MEFQIHKSGTGYAQKYYWKIVAANHETLATSEMYFNKADAESAARSVKSNAAAAKIVDKTGSVAAYYGR
jgi:uncharacterized protein YegP (UPF0339 family)